MSSKSRSSNAVAPNARHLAPAEPPVVQPTLIKRPSPIYALRTFLSPSPNSHNPPSHYTPNALRSLYMSSRSQKHLFTPDQLSSLISLFVSLSTESPHPLSHLLRKEYIGTSKTYPKFIAMVTNDKRALGHQLSSVDQYWLMRLHLRGLGQKDHGTPNSRSCHS